MDGSGERSADPWTLIGGSGPRLFLCCNPTLNVDPFQLMESGACHIGHDS